MFSALTSLKWRLHIILVFTATASDFTYGMWLKNTPFIQTTLLWPIKDRTIPLLNLYNRSRDRKWKIMKRRGLDSNRLKPPSRRPAALWRWGACPAEAWPSAGISTSSNAGTTGAVWIHCESDWTPVKSEHESFNVSRVSQAEEYEEGKMPHSRLLLDIALNDLPGCNCDIF